MSAVDACELVTDVVMVTDAPGATERGDVVALLIYDVGATLGVAVGVDDAVRALVGVGVFVGGPPPPSATGF